MHRQLWHMEILFFSPEEAGETFASDKTFSADGASTDGDFGGPSLLLPEVE